MVPLTCVTLAKARSISTALTLLLNNLFFKPIVHVFFLLSQLPTYQNFWLKIIHSHSSRSFTICYLTPYTRNERFIPLLGNTTKIWCQLFQNMKMITHLCIEKLLLAFQMISGHLSCSIWLAVTEGPVWSRQNIKPPHAQVKPLLAYILSDSFLFHGSLARNHVALLTAL